MQSNTSAECPKCGRPLQRFNGRIGYCSQHKWVSPIGLGAEAEAAEQNRLDAAETEKRRLEEERQRIQEKAHIQREQHAAAVRKAVAVVVAICLVIAAGIFFIVRPSMNYNGATEKFMAGDYQQAQKVYSSLGDYKDSAARVTLCGAMLDLQEGKPEDAVKKLDQLTAEGAGAVAKQLADALLPVMAKWKASGLSPQALLILLEKVHVIDPDGTLDAASLRVEGHQALLDGNALSSYAEDLQGDGDPELVVLNADYSVTVYRMTTGGNVRMAVDNETAAACGMHFGGTYNETNPDAAVACYAEAYRLLPNDETRAALTAAYRLRAADHENAGDMAAAIADSRKAMETSGADEDFIFFYGMNLRNCKNGHDAATAIAMWNEFSAVSSAEITRFGAHNLWKDDAAQLHIARAAELAAQKDEGCIDELRIAANMGANITGAIAEAQSHFEPGLALARLRLMEIELVDGDPGKKEQIRADMAGEVRLAIKEWKDRGITPSDVPALIQLADAQHIDIGGIEWESIYEEAALAAAGSVAQSSFVDWDADGYKELLALNADGKLSLYGMAETWRVISFVDTKLPASSYVIADEGAPLILVLSSGEDELLALTGMGNALSVLFRETGIRRYALDGSTVTFSKPLEGSIIRYNDYTYEAVGVENRPVRTGIDWQQNDYPKPASAEAAVRRYFEARAYDIPDEAAVLATESSAPAIFSGATLASLAAPDVPGTVEATAYLAEAERELFEVNYPSETQTVRTWIAAEYIGGWKIVGAADTYGAGKNPSEVDYSLPLISLNSETSNRITERGGRNTYRILLPTAGGLSLVWQSGDKKESRTAYAVSLYRGTLAANAVIAYDLQPNTARQQTKPMFMNAGVYYVTVEARIADAPEYHLTMMLDAQTHVELEDNDTPATATPVELNTPYSGSLLTSKDIDFFSFVLDATSAVNVTLGTPGTGGKSPTHLFAVMSAANGTRLATKDVPGNARLSETGNLYLSAGTYLVQVNKGSAWINDEYALTVNASQDGTMESESNNTPETANAVPVNEDIHASIGQEGDVDYFSFALIGDAVVQPRFTFKPTDSSSKTYVLTLLDGTRRELLKVSIGGKESTKVIAPVALNAGTYTVKIENPRFVRQDYTLHLASIDVAAAEKEPNDSAALATDLVVGSPRTGVLSSDADIDYYKLTFTDQTAVMLKFNFPQSTNKNTAYIVAIEQNGKTQWTANVKGDSGGVEQQLQFPAGEYYVKVKPSTWISAVYTLSIN